MEIKRVITKKKAKEVAALINKYAGFPLRRRYNDIISKKDRVFFAGFYKSRLVGCIGVKKDYFYSSELINLCVKPEFGRRGFGTKLISEMTKRFGEKRPIFFSTIREKNIASQVLFRKLGFKKITEFTNPETGHKLGLYFLNYQKQHVHRH